MQWPQWDMRNLLTRAVSPTVIALLILFSLIGFTVYQQFSAYLPDSPHVVDGTLTVSDADVLPIQLQGYWRFYWQQLLLPQQLTENYELVRVPNRWNDMSLNGVALGGEGFATYAMDITLNKPSVNLGLQIPTLYRAAHVWANGQLIVQAGKPGASRQEEVPRDEIQIARLPEGVRHIRLVIQVSSFHHVDGGMHHPIIIDEWPRLVQDEKWRVVRGVFLMSSTLTLAFYLLIMWANAHAGREYFYLGMGLLWYSARLFGTEKLIFYLYPNFSVEWLLRAEYFGMYLCIPAYMLFIQALFPRDLNYRLLRVFWWLGIAATVVTCLTGSYWYSRLRDPYEILCLLCMIYFIGCLIRIVWYRRQWSGLVSFLGGITVLLFINEVLYYREVVSFHLTPWVYVFVALTSLIFLGQRMNRLLASEAEQSARLQQAVAERTWELQDKVQELDVARRHALELAERRTEFMAVLSHEIRTPLSGLLGALRLLAGRDAEAERDQLQVHALEAGESLLAVVSDALDATSLGRHDTLTFSCQQLDYFFSSIASMMEIQARNKHLLFSLHADASTANVWALTDYQKIRQITVNLLSNAIKFTEAGSVALTVSLLPDRLVMADKEACLSIRVEDTGVGIAGAELPRIFEAYVQLDAGGDKARGKGLGLSIAQQLVDVLGGRITVSSEPGKGTVFDVRVGVDRCDPLVSSDSRETEDVVAGCRVLVVEDDEANMTVVSTLLQQDGHKVVATASPTRAIRQLQGFPFDVCLFDIRLPEMPGTELVKRARQLVHARPLFVALTANTGSADLASYQQAGFDYVLEKPVDLQQLRYVLARARKDSGEGDSFLLSSRQQPASQSIIDREFWQRIIGDLGPDRSRQLLAAVESSVGSSLMVLAAQVSGGESEQIEAAAHKLKSAARSAGMSQLAQLADELEKAPESLAERWIPLQSVAETSLSQLSASLAPGHNAEL